MRKDPVIKEIYALAVPTSRLRRSAGVKIYLVGGVLRNLLIGEAPGADYDLCVEGGADRLKGGTVREVSRRLAEALGGSFFLLDEESSTWRIAVKGDIQRTVDIAPVRGSGITADLKERDFTVNATALDIRDVFENERPSLVDPCEGIEDAKKRILRPVSAMVFDEDPLRMLRAVRLSQQYAFKVEKSTRAWIKEKARLIKKSAMERIRDEMTLMFAHPGTAESMKTLFTLGLLGTIIPELKYWQSGEDGWQSGEAGWQAASYDIASHSLKTLKEADYLASGRQGRLAGRRGRSVGRAEKLNGGLKGFFDFEGGMGRQAERTVTFKLAAFFHDIGKPLTMKAEGEDRQGRLVGRRGRSVGRQGRLSGLSFMGHDVEGEILVKKILRRLKFSRRVIRAVAAIVRNHHRIFTLASLSEPSGRTRAHFFNAAGKAGWQAGGETGLFLLMLGLADARATRGSEDRRLLSVVKEMLEFYFNVYARGGAESILGGGEIMDTFNVAEGPVVGRIMRELCSAFEEGTVRGKKDAVRHIRKWLKVSESEERGKKTVDFCPRRY
ncbi:MAG: HD domain-containing protein [Deltaproteobacteria bacterium]|nr:HD domain-containing protein [Deltaproteobacteria bacterium]